MSHTGQSLRSNNITVRRTAKAPEKRNRKVEEGKVISRSTAGWRGVGVCYATLHFTNVN